MGIDERIEALQASIAALHATAVVHGVNIESLHSSLGDLYAKAAKENETMRENLQQLYSTTVRQGENITALAASINGLARLAELQGNRIAALENGAS